MSDSDTRTSALLQNIFKDNQGADISIRQITTLLGDWGLAFGILLFALPGVVAGAIPGFSTLTGLPILLISLQIAVGRRAIWLPDSIMEKKLSVDTLDSALKKCVLPLQRLEKLLCPRMQWLICGYAERLIGLLMAVLALVLSLPIPAGNFLPSIGICMLALAILERDGLLAALGLTFVVATASFMLELIVFAVKFIIHGVSALI